MPKARLGLLLVGAWQVFWLLMAVAAALVGNIGAIFVFVAMTLPASFYWRRKYSRRADQTGASPPGVLAGCVLPIRDAWAEWRASKGAGRGSRV